MVKGKKASWGQTGAAYNVRDIVKARPMITYRIGVPERKGGPASPAAQWPGGTVTSVKIVRIGYLGGGTGR